MQPRPLRWRLTMLAVIVAGLVTMWACSGPAPQAGAAPNPAFEAKVNAALDEIERRALADWAEYGREMLADRRIGNSQAFDTLGMTFWVDGRGYIALRDEWEALDVGAAGEVLLEELFHLRTLILSHPQELVDLLARYWVGE